MKSPGDSVVVITGASSGIGRACAYAFAREHARLVLAARRGERISQVAKKCSELGAAECRAVPCDVSQPQDVISLAERTLAHFGGFDVWINNAAVTAFGRSDDMPYEIYRQVIETNLLGCIHGARAAVKQFRRQGRGMLINVASMAGKIAHPWMSAYSTSKYGVVGLSDSLRAELRHEPDIYVCTVLPVATDTPLFQHGANYFGREAKPPPPVHHADRVARAIVALARHPRPEVAIGAMGKFFWLFNRVSPALAQRAMARFIEQSHFRRKAFPPHAGNVLSPTDDPYAVTGGWKDGSSNAPFGGLKQVMALSLVVAGAWAVYSLARAGTQTARLTMERRSTSKREASRPAGLSAKVSEERDVRGHRAVTTLAGGGSSLHLDRSR